MATVEVAFFSLTAESPAVVEIAEFGFDVTQTEPASVQIAGVTFDTGNPATPTSVQIASFGIDIGSPPDAAKVEIAGFALRFGPDPAKVQIGSFFFTPNDTPPEFTTMWRERVAGEWVVPAWTMMMRVGGVWVPV